MIEGSPDGTFVVSKQEATGGLVNVDTVSEQLLYEMGSPKYITPDVTADFASIELSSDGPNRVRVSGIKGEPPTGFYKVSASYRKGYKSTGQLTIAGPQAYEKAQLCSDIIWKRLKRAGYEFSDKQVEYLGVNSSHEGVVSIPDQINEVVLRVGVKDNDRQKVERFGKEIAPLVTSGPPGVTGFAGGRPKPQEIIAFFPTLIPKEKIKIEVDIKES